VHPTARRDLTARFDHNVRNIPPQLRSKRNSSTQRRSVASLERPPAEGRHRVMSPRAGTPRWALLAVLVLGACAVASGTGHEDATRTARRALTDNPRSSLGRFRRNGTEPPAPESPGAPGDWPPPPDAPDAPSTPETPERPPAPESPEPDVPAPPSPPEPGALVFSPPPPEPTPPTSPAPPAPPTPPAPPVPPARARHRRARAAPRSPRRVARRRRWSAAGPAASAWRRAQ